MMVNSKIYRYLDKYKEDLENDAFSSVEIVLNSIKLTPANIILIFWKIFGFETPSHQKGKMDGTMNCVWREKTPL